MAAQDRRFLKGFVAGLAVGLLLSLAVALWVGRNNPFVETPSAPEVAGEVQTAPAAAPSYEFYKGEAVPEPTPPAESPAATRTAAYYLQAGAFLHAEDAEAMRARLALLGFEADIQRVPDAQAIELYKVRLGPFRGMDELNPARARLTQNGIDTLLITASQNPDHSSKETP